MEPELTGNHKRSLMAACEYSIGSLVDVKKEMLNLGSKNNKAAWAIGGMLVNLVAHLIKAFEEVLEQGSCDAIADLKETQVRFNRFIASMLNDEKNL